MVLTIQFTTINSYAMPTMPLNIILASSSPYRQAILHNLGLKFRSVSPDIDETPLNHEAASALTQRLAIAKARAVNADNSYIIGSDQVAALDGDILGKPNTVDNAITQLTRFSARQVTFYTGLCLRYNDQIQSIVEPFSVEFKALSQAQIVAYVNKEQPLNCAGSFKSEGMGMLLFKALHGRDPNSLIGLPVIALNELFQLYGIDLLTDT